MSIIVLAVRYLIGPTRVSVNVDTVLNCDDLIGSAQTEMLVFTNILYLSMIYDVSSISVHIYCIISHDRSYEQPTLAAMEHPVCISVLSQPLSFPSFGHFRRYIISMCSIKGNHNLNGVNKATYQSKQHQFASIPYPIPSTWRPVHKIALLSFNDQLHALTRIILDSILKI